MMGDARGNVSREERWALFVAFGLLVAFRLPLAWTHGRFLDEEATVFLAYAWHRPWLDSLFRPFGGYWNLPANAITLVVVALVKGGVLPLERAPYLTMLTSLAAQMLPAVVILTARAPWLTSRWAMIAALLLFSILPGTEEIFLNAMHIQFQLALCAALILALDVPGRRRGRVAYNALLVLAPLCGPGAIAILPLFALRALIDRDTRRVGQFTLFAAGSAIQLLLFFSANPMRGDPRGPVTMAATMLVRLFALPAFGMDKANHIGDALYRSDAAGGAGPWWAAGAACLLLGALVIAGSRRRDAAIWLVFSTLSIAAATFGFGMVIVRRFDLFDVGAGERYNFLPLALIGLTLIVLATRAGAPGRTACGAICALMLVVGAVHYPYPRPAFRDGPSWAAEVAAWRLDHRHPLAVWPRPWAADLSDENPRCSPVGPDTPTSHDPRYCESGWIAAFFRPPLSTGHDTQLAARLSAWASRRKNGAP